MKYFLVGILGTGMSALALSLKERNEIVEGSDESTSFFTFPSLDEHHIPVYRFHKKNIEDHKDFFFIIGYAYQEDHEEVQEILRLGLPYSYYADFIESYYQGVKIGISGTHGKTTTALFLTQLLSKEDICAIVGDGTGIGNDPYQYLILEACEYRQHFLKYHFDELLINNIDYDHPDYFNSIDEVFFAFQRAANRSKRVYINQDDEKARQIQHKNKITFSLYEPSDVQGKIIEEKNNGFMLEVKTKDQQYTFFLPFTGIHMVYNFLAAFAIYSTINQKIDILPSHVFNFNKPKRRMEEVKCFDNIIINDYGHHPTEIRATLSSIKQKYPSHYIITIFQPHTYSRTIYLYQEFQTCFSLSDEVYVALTFPSSREERDPFKDKLVKDIFQGFSNYEEEDLERWSLLHKTVFLFIGAGNIYEDANKLFMKINEKSIEKKNKI